MDLTKLSEETLKAMAYDQIKIINTAQSNLMLLEKELSSRRNQIEIEEKKDE